MKFIASAVIILLALGCVPTRKVIGVYGTDYGDTMRVVEDHSWRIELAEPDTVDHKQFKYTTGRWYKKRNKLELHVDARSMGTFWECVPMKIGWGRLRRNMECDGKGKNYIFEKINYRKLRRVARKEAKREVKREKKEQDEKMKRKMEELEASD